MHTQNTGTPFWGPAINIIKVKTTALSFKENRYMKNLKIARKFFETV
jgi:hypothetical protein